MIRAQVSWWPGNVETKGGTHVHHMVWGILLIMSMGYLGISTDIPSPWFELVAIAFGIGMGLTLDEFALWLNLQDVYWQEKGRQSIDAVVVTTALLVIALLGLEFWIAVWDAVLVLAGVDHGGHIWVAVPVQLLGVVLAVVCFRKGRKLTGIVGLFVPLVALIGAVVPAPRAGAFQRLITARLALVAEHRDRRRVEREQRPASGGRPTQRAAITRSTWPWANRADVAVERRRSRRSGGRRAAPTSAGRLATRAAVAPQVPVRPRLADLRRRDPLVLAVVPLEQVLVSRPARRSRPAGRSRARARAGSTARARTSRPPSAVAQLQRLRRPFSVSGMSVRPVCCRRWLHSGLAVAGEDDLHGGGNIAPRGHPLTATPCGA